MSLNSKLVGAAGLVLAATGSLAAAQEVRVTAPAVPEDLIVQSKKISFSDLNLTMASHQRMLSGRVGRAVGDVCELPGDRLYSSGYQTCRSLALQQARPQMSLAIRRTQEIAATGTSAIPPVAIVIAFPGR